MEEQSPPNKGTLHVVATPIGNLGDITLRAIETLRRVSVVAAEDTRRARALLSHLGISNKTLICIEAHAERRRLQPLADALASGADVALTTDAGMPAVSDPGSFLVGELAARGFSVRVVPGPSALTSAIAVSGLVGGAFLFLGFLPRRGGRRTHSLERIVKSVEPVVLFEAPSRCAATLHELGQLMPGRPVAIARELSKVHEEVVRGRLAELEARAWRGEIVIVIGPDPNAEQVARPDPAECEAEIVERVERGESTRSIVDALRADAGLPRRELYSKVETERRRQGR